MKVDYVVNPPVVSIVSNREISKPNNKHITWDHTAESEQKQIPHF